MSDLQATDRLDIEAIRAELAKGSPSAKRRAFEKFVLAALGSIPWVGGFVSAAIAFKLEEPGVKQDSLQSQWLEEHQRKIERLMASLNDVTTRFENLGEGIDERIQSEEYLDIVRRAFRTWDKADTDEKRRYIGNLVANAAGTRLCSDDVVRLFVDWLDLYHEAHFAVIREIYQRPGSSRYEIWTAIYGQLPRENSAEADLFRKLVRDLSTGGVIRQERETNVSGQFIQRQRQRSRGSPQRTMKSSFDENEPYALTELGKQFVHYTMNEVVPRLEPP